MKKINLIGFLCFYVLTAFAQSNNVITIGKIDGLHSKILNEEREIWVHVPENNSKVEIHKQKKYPVVYLLDGKTHFYSVVGMLKEMSSFGEVQR